MKSGKSVTRSKPSELHPGPFVGEDLEIARAAATLAIERYGDFDAETMRLFRQNGIWNDHVSVQAALAVVHYMRGRTA